MSGEARRAPVASATRPTETGSVVTEARRRPRASIRRLITGAALVGAWCALWGEVSVANLLSGVLVAIAALRFGVGGSGRGGIRLVPLVRLAALVATDMVRSTFAVMREVLTPTDDTQEGIIAVPIPPASKHHLLLLFVAITVTPGTAVVAAESDGSVLYLHVLHCDRREPIEAHVQQLAELTNAALPVTDESAIEPRNALEGNGRSGESRGSNEVSS